MITSDGSLRCDQCGKKLGSGLIGSVVIVCPRCKRYNTFDLARHLGILQTDKLTKPETYAMVENKMA